MFRSILQTFGTKNHAKLVFRAGKDYFEVLNFRKKLYHEHIQSNLLDRKRCLGVFRSISQTFNTKIHEKVVFRGWRHYFGYRTSGKSFATNTSNVTYSIQNDGWECFGAFHKPSTQKFIQKLYLEVESTISGYRTSGKSFATNASNLTYSIQNDVWECFGAFRKPSTQEFIQKLYLEAESTILGVPNIRKMFCHEHIQSNLLDPKWCFALFWSISQTFDTKIHEKVVFRGWMHYSVVPNIWKTFATNPSNLTY